MPLSAQCTSSTTNRTGAPEANSANSAATASNSRNRSDSGSLPGGSAGPPMRSRCSGSSGATPRRSDRGGTRARRLAPPASTSRTPRQTAGTGAAPPRRSDRTGRSRPPGGRRRRTVRQGATCRFRPHRRRPRSAPRPSAAGPTRRGGRAAPSRGPRTGHRRGQQPRGQRYGRAGREVVETAAHGQEGREVDGEQGVAELEHPLGANEAAQLMEPQVAQRRAVGQPVADELRGGVGHDDLPAVREAAEPGATVHGRSLVVAVRELRFTGVERHAHPDYGLVRPRLRVQRALQCDRAPQGIACPSEHRERAITLPLVLGAAAAERSEVLSNERIVACERPPRLDRVRSPGLRVEPSTSVSRNVTVPDGSSTISPRTLRLCSKASRTPRLTSRTERHRSLSPKDAPERAFCPGHARRADDLQDSTQVAPAGRVDLRRRNPHQRAWLRLHSSGRRPGAPSAGAGSSPHATSSYACAFEIPNSRPTSSTVHTSRSVPDPFKLIGPPLLWYPTLATMPATHGEVNRLRRQAAELCSSRGEKSAL